MDFLIKEICIFLYVKIINKYDLEYYLVMNKSIDKYEFINNNHLFNYIKAYSYFRSLNLPSNVEDYVKIENINNLIVDKCMLRGTKGEGDNWYTKVYNKGINIYIDMFNDFFCMLKNSKQSIKSTDFIINIFDHPIINKSCKFFVGICKNEEEVKNPPTIVLSPATTINHYDLLLPYQDVWELASQRQFHNGSGIPSNNYLESEINKMNTEWYKKKQTIIFKGRNTGCFPNSIEDNVRLNAYYNILKNILKLRNIGVDLAVDIVGKIRINYLSIKSIDDFNIEYTDFIIIKKKLIEKLNKDSNIDPELKIVMERYFNTHLLPNEESRFSQTREEQSYNKYLLNIDGFVTAWRLPCDFANNSVILSIDNPENYTSYFYNLLKNGENYVKINNNMDNLIDRVRYLRDNDDIAKSIALNGYKLYKVISKKENLLKYIYHVFNMKNNNMSIRDWGLDKIELSHFNTIDKINNVFLQQNNKLKLKLKYLKYKQKYLLLKNKL